MLPEGTGKERKGSHTPAWWTGLFALGLLRALADGLHFPFAFPMREQGEPGSVVYCSLTERNKESCDLSPGCLFVGGVAVFLFRAGHQVAVI